MSLGFFKGLALALCFTATTASSFVSELVVNDPDGVLAATQSPVVMPLKLKANEQRAVAKGKLQLRELSGGVPVADSIPAQLVAAADAGSLVRICWLMPPGPKGQRTFRLEVIRGADLPEVSVRKNSQNGQFDFTDGSKPVLRYNYESIDSRLRSDHVHPLFGLDGETLTQDWSPDLPQHRGIYWAWPNIGHGHQGGQQRVSARPTGKCAVTTGPVFAQIEAENIWHWDDTNAIVRERAIIRTYRATAENRIIDFEFQFTALGDPVLLTRRHVDKYGGLSAGLAAVTNQQIITYTGTNATPLIAWAELSGQFGAATQTTAIVLIPHDANPDYPGEWVQNSRSNWLQSSFPASGTGYELKPGRPLVLRFRLLVHRNSAGAEYCTRQWRAFHMSSAPQFFPMASPRERPITP